MSPRFETVTIIGVGLLGASLGLGMKKRGLAGCVRGVGHRAETLEKALKAGAVDEISQDAVEASINADLIVVCTPAARVPEYLDAIRKVCGPKTVVTDVASTKADICTHARKAWADPLRFIGSHPMAGSEKFGPEHATADLYDGSVCLVEKAEDQADDARAAVVSLWESLGARVLDTDPEAHDALVARTSHVPHIVAAALARLTEANEGVLPYLGKGFRDATRIAEGRPELWRDICLTNAGPIRDALEEMVGALRDVSKAIDSEDADILEKYFRRGRDARKKALEE